MADDEIENAGGLEPELRLAGNYIPTTAGPISGFNGGYGHLQWVYVDEQGNQLELEVRAPGSKTMGHWDVPDITDHTQSTRYGVEGDYAYTTVMKGDEATEAFGILKQYRDQLHAETERDPGAYDYDKDNNSNSYNNTGGHLIGVDVQAILDRATPPDLNNGTPLVDRFPGVQRNVFSDPENPNTDVFDLNINGYSGDNTITTDLGNNILTGRGGGDILSSGRGEDTLIAADTVDPYDATAQSRFEAREDGYSPYNDGSIDWLRGGEGNDLYVVGTAAREDGQNEVVKMDENGEPIAGEDGLYFINPGLDIIDDADGKGSVQFSLDGYESTDRNHYGTFSGGDFTEVPDADTVYPRYSGEGELDILHIDNFSYQNQSGADVSGDLYVFIDKVNEHPVFAITGREGENFDINLQAALETEPANSEGLNAPVPISPEPSGTDTTSSQETSLHDVVQQLEADMPDVQETIAARAADGTLSFDEALIGKAVSQTGTAQMFTDLDAAGVTTLEVQAIDPADSMSRTQASLGAAADALRENELPVPETEYIPERDHTGVTNEIFEMAMEESGEAANDVLQQDFARQAAQLEGIATHPANLQDVEADYDYAM